MKKIYLIAAVIALVAGFATYFFASELKTSKIVTGVDEATVVVAVNDIDKNTILTKEMFQTVKLPVTAVPYGSVANVNDVIGYMATDRILAGEYLVVRKIALIGDMSSEGRLSYQLKNGMYAYTIYVSDENGVGYFIKEDDRVNVYNDNLPSAEPVLKNVPILRIGDYPSNILQDGGTEITSYKIVTLALTKEQIPKMMELENPDSESDKLYRLVLVSFAEGHELVDDIQNAQVPESRNEVPVTNYGMGEITTSPPTTAKE